MRTRSIVSFLIVISLLIPVSCKNKVKNLEEEIKVLREENAYLKAQNRSLKKEIDELYKKLEECKSVQKNREK